MPSIGSPELLLILAIAAPFAAIPSLITWGRGGSRGRIGATFLVGLVPYIGWVAAYVIAFTTQRPVGASESAAIPSATLAKTSASSAPFCGSCGAPRTA